MMRSPRRLLPLLGLPLLLAPTAAAARLRLPTAQTLSAPRALAMGDAFRAVASSNEAIYFNLAGMAQAPKYELDLAYLRNNGLDQDVYNASIVDAKTGRVAAALAYTRMLAEAEGEELSGSIVHLGLAFPLSVDVALGAGVKYLGFTAPEDTNAVTLDAGLLVRAHELVSVAATISNAIDVSSREAPRQAGVGLAVGEDTSLRAASDVVFDFSGDGTALSYHAGAEYLLAGQFPIRAGFKRFAETNRNYVSGGIGWISPEAGLEAAYVQNLEGEDEEDRTFGLTLKLFL